MFPHNVAYILTFHLYRHEDTFVLRVRGENPVYYAFLYYRVR